MGLLGNVCTCVCFLACERCPAVCLSVHVQLNLRSVLERFISYTDYLTSGLSHNVPVPFLSLPLPYVELSQFSPPYALPVCFVHLYCPSVCPPASLSVCLLLWQAVTAHICLSCMPVCGHMLSADLYISMPVSLSLHCLLPCLYAFVSACNLFPSSSGEAIICLPARLSAYFCRLCVRLHFSHVS